MSHDPDEYDEGVLLILAAIAFGILLAILLALEAIT